MKIAGLDISINGSGIVVMDLDNNLDSIHGNYLSFTTIKKFSQPNIMYFKKNQFKTDQHQNEWMKLNIMLAISGCDYVAVEGYAFAGKGAIFDIAEMTGLIKHTIFLDHIKMRVYDPCSIKMYATGKGNSEKKGMQDFYDAYTGKDKFDLSMLKDWRSPKTDVIDAWWIAKLLQLEMKLRRGLVQLKDLTEKQIQIFNRTTKGNPVNLLATDFIQKETPIV